MEARQPAAAKGGLRLRQVVRSGVLQLVLAQKPAACLSLEGLIPPPRHY